MVLNEAGIGRQFAFDNLRNDSIYNLFGESGLDLDGGHAKPQGLFCDSMTLRLAENH